jgi:hypothetical protein
MRFHLILSLLISSLPLMDGYATEEDCECHQSDCEKAYQECPCVRPWYEDEKNIEASWPSKREDDFYDALTR